ncbi:MAG: SUMF1/EgtB/PvdO family nonheme iron enzyme [Gammaproteobacteria bacterium]|nr:SUMF1/EgtB/PvdO family nonheme iron enzyme [Gammaproteobacteria bacterium]
MADFKTALQALSRGELNLDVVAKNIDKVLRKSPKLATQMLEELRAAYGNDLIDAQTYASLKKRVQDVVGLTDTGGSTDDATRFGSADSTQILTDADREAIAAEARAATQIDYTGTDTSGTVDFDLSGPTTGTSAESWGTTGTGAAGTGWAQPGKPQEVEPLKIQPGVVLKERFRLMEVLGVGGMGTVYRGVDLLKEEARDKNPYVALKVLNEDFKQHPDSFIALQREASRQQKLAHPNIATVYDFDRTGSTVFITMELMEGTPLNVFIKKNAKSKGGLPFAEAWPIIEGLGRGLTYAHERSMVHSDFKPGNCFLLKDGAIKILDFGIARAVKNPLAGEAEKTLFDPGKLGALTPAYASAEMLEGEDPDPRDDIYALACVAYELLTGRHPFNKLPANAARDNKLMPAPIKGLKRRQWKGLLRGLAFARADRSQSVQEFLEQIEGKSNWYKNPFIVGGAITLVAVLAGTPQIVSYLQKQKIDGVIAAINGGDPQVVQGYLDQLPRLREPDAPESDLDADDEKRILDETRDTLISYFESRIATLTDEREFRAAEGLLSDLKSLFPDNIKVVQIDETVVEKQNFLLAQLNDRINKALDDGKLLASGDDEGIATVLQDVSKVAPEQVKYYAPRLSAALSAQAEEALLSLDFDRAQTVVDEGLALVKLAVPGKNDVILVNLADKIRNTREQSEQDQLIAEAESRIEAALPQLTDLGSYAGLGDAVARLARNRPDHPLLADLAARVAPLLQTEAKRIRSERDWTAVGALDGQQALFAGLGLENELLRLDTERAEFDQRVDGLLKQLAAAVAEDRLQAPAQPNATTILADMSAAAGSAGVVERARDALARAYLHDARKLRANGDWAQARQALSAAGKLGPSATVGEQLATETTLVGRLEKLAPAERAKLLADRSAEAQTLHAELDRQIADMAPTPLAAQSVLATVDRIAALDPGDAKIATARDAVAGRLADAATSIGEGGAWDAAIATLRDAVALVPESTRLASTFEQLRENARTALATAQQKAIEDGKTRIAELLAEPTFDRAFDVALQERFDKLQPFLPADDPWLTATRREAGEKYVARATQMREEQRFEEAGSLLDKGERYAPALDALANERQQLAAAEQDFQRARDEELRKAEIDGLKQTVLTQAKAREVTNVKATLDKLRELLPPDDPFLVQEVPPLLGDAYLKLAQSMAEKGNFIAALKFAREGVEISPNDQQLQQAVRANTLKGNEAELRQLFTGEITGLDVDLVKKSLGEIQLLDPSRYVAVAGDLEKILADRIQPLIDQDLSAADNLMKKGKVLFGDSELLAKLDQQIETRKAAQQVCKSCPLIRDAMDARRLTKAQALLRDAKKDPGDKDHPDIARVAADLTKQIATAEEALAAFKTEQDRLQQKGAVTEPELKQAEMLLAAAQKVWIDRSYEAQANWLKQELDKLRPRVPGKVEAGYPGQVFGSGIVLPYSGSSPQPCKPGLAGYGTRKRGQCFALLDDNKRGPLMVVVPAGSGVAKPFAISKYEITYYDYNRFCELSNWCKPIPVSKDKISLPVTNISIKDAEAFTDWLSKRTGASYRLPSAEEWAYAADAAGKQPKKDYNCRLEQGGQVLKGQAVMSVTTGKPNGWGLFNYIGNVQEWATSGNGIVVRGGAYQDSFSKCDVSLERSHDGSRDEATGFRIVLDMG